MNSLELFCLKKGNIYAIPILHYNMEMAAQVHLAFQRLAPDCVAVELAETMELQLLHAASRLPDISVVVTADQQEKPLYYLAEPCDGAFEGLRCALEAQVAAHCIDLDVDDYPLMKDPIPDPYAIQRLGLKAYYEAYAREILSKQTRRLEVDERRELHMAKRLKELSLQHDTVLFVGGMYHVQAILDLVDRSSFPESSHAPRKNIQVCTLSEGSAREVMAEYGWISMSYEEIRQQFDEEDEDLAFVGINVEDRFPPDRQKLLLQLYKQSGEKYKESSGLEFPGYHLRNLMRFARNYALLKGRLMPDLFETLTVAKGCVDHNYAYEAWLLATDYPHLRNVDGLPELDLSIEDVWGHSKIIRFHMRQPSRKWTAFDRRRQKNKRDFRFEPPGPFSICSYPPEDLVVENFGDFLQKKGTQILTEEGGRTIPFSNSLEDGIDVKETIRHWSENKLFVKVSGRPPGGVGSVVMIFDEDSPEEGKVYHEQYPWKTTWLGEHAQESDMAFYATDQREHVVGPGISRCKYGGFMMSYPPRRMYDVWQDPDYSECRTKAEVLLMAAIDYAVKPVVVYVAAKPPRSFFKQFASRFGRKIVYIPIGQLSPVTLKKVRIFHVLDGHDKRDIADEYIY